MGPFSWCTRERGCITELELCSGVWIDRDFELFGSYLTNGCCFVPTEVCKSSVLKMCLSLWWNSGIGTDFLLTLDTIVVGRVSSKCCLQAKVSENAMALDVVILSNLYHILDSPSGKKSICHNLESQKSLILFCVVPFSRNFAIYFCSFIIYH